MSTTEDIQAMMDEICDAGAGFGVSTTVRVVSEGAMNAATGVRGEATADGSVSAVRHDRRMQIGGRGQPDTQFVMFTIRVSEAAVIRRGDRIVDGSIEYFVHKVDRVAMDKVWECWCQTVKPV